jgi:hypothetical protein
MNEEKIRAFFNDLAQTLEQSARGQNPSSLPEYLRNHMQDDAVITVANELYLGNTLVAQTMAQIPEDTLSDALGMASPAIHGRRLVQDYNVDFRIRDIRLVPGTNTARVFASVNESGRFMVGDAASRLAGIRQRFAEMGAGGRQTGQMQGGIQGQMSGQTSGQGMGQQGQVQGWSKQLPQGFPESLRFQANSNCIFDVVQEGNQIKIGNTFCRGESRLS